MKICLTCEGVTEAEDDARCVHCGRPLVAAAAVRFPLRRGDDGRHGPLVGRLVDGKYRVLGVLGRGGMGTVYRAVHEVSHAPVALKVLNPRFASRPDFRQWFLAEARKAGRIVHENSARVQDVGETADGVVYLAVEYVDGHTLRSCLEEGGAPAPAWIVDVLEQTARGLAAAHDAGVVHRDLSPRNVMVVNGLHGGGGPRVKILDFGIATGAPGSEAVRVGGGVERSAPVMFANPPYSAPEHVAGAEVDGRADLYSLGVIAFEALSGGAWPVDGTTSEELATATRDGRIRGALPRRRGVPRELRRLVAELLRREPARRPASAHEVAARLARLRSRSGRGLSVAALGSLVVGGVGYAWASGAESAAPYLRTLPGTRTLAVTAAPAASDEAARALRSRDLLATTFAFGGFRPRDLSVRISRGAQRFATLSLADAVVADGARLRFGGAATGAVVGALREASRQGPVDVAFLRDGREPIGYARLRLDDEPPRLGLSVVGPDGPVLLGASVLRIAAHDDGRLVDLRLQVRSEAAQGGGVQRTELPLTPAPSGRIEGPAAELLGSVLTSTRTYGATVLQLVARDAAGNAARAAPLRFDNVDLRAPALRSVLSARGGRVVVERADGCRLSVQCEAAEPGLTLQARPPERDDWSDLATLPARGGLDPVDIELPRGVASDPSTGYRPSGTWAFRLRDRAGNVGPELAEQLEFRPDDPLARFELPAATDAARPPAVQMEDQLVGRGVELALRFTCNPLYRPVSFTVTEVGGGEVHAAAADAAVAGRGTLHLPPLPDGVYRLDVRIDDDAAAESLDVAGPELRVLRGPPVLRIPAAPGARYLGALLDAAVFEREGERLAQGAGWELEPADTRLLRGRVFAGVERLTVRAELGGGGRADRPILPAVALQRGEMCVAVDLQDVLGRPVDVRIGDRPAPAQQVFAGDAVTARLVARFWHHDAPLSLVEPVALLEHGQPLRLTLRSEVPLPAERERVALAIGGRPLHPQRVREAASGAGSELSFVIPFERVAVAADLTGLDREDFAAGRRAVLVAELRSPLATQSMDIEIRTIRSALRPVRLGDIAAGLPPELAALELVPVLGPGADRPLQDPVPADFAGRGRLRPTPPIEVRNVGDFYLQRAELSGEEYAAIVRAGLRRVTAGALPAGVAASDLVHGFDPLGAERLAVSALLPRGPAATAGGLPGLAGHDRPVTGVDAFQAHCVVRLAGLLVGDDPALFRLPFGVELELAALGGRSGLCGGELDRATWLALSPQVPPGTAPRSDESRRFGDVVTTDLGYELVGLDAGVREWVADLPFVAAEPDGRALLSEWLADHVRHAQRAAELGARRVAAFPSDLLDRLAIYGVIRGSATLGGRRGDAFEAPGGIGVVRALQVRRDGAGLLPGTLDPHVLQAGLRLVGARGFIARVRRR